MIHLTSPRLKLSFTNFITYSCSESKLIFGDKAIQFGSYQLKRVNETKFLGVIIDEKLKWNSHIKPLGKKFHLQ